MILTHSPWSMETALPYPRNTPDPEPDIDDTWLLRSSIDDLQAALRLLRDQSEQGYPEIRRLLNSVVYRLSGDLGSKRDEHMQPNLPDPSSCLRGRTERVGDSSRIKFLRYDEFYAVMDGSAADGPTIAVRVPERSDSEAGNESRRYAEAMKQQAVEVTQEAAALMTEAISKGWDAETAAHFAAEKVGAALIVIPEPTA